ncbi:MAG: YecA family protein [Deltaproteobacteria bacterium]
MKDIGRNDPCPCGSGKKFKKCHMGREEELVWEGTGEATIEDMGVRIANLPTVHYGRSREMLAALNLPEMTRSSMGIKFVDLVQYSRLNVWGSASVGDKRGGVLINVYKTQKADPEHVYIAISEDVDDGTLVHQLAHALMYMAGSKLPAGTLDPLAYEIGIPTDHLEHPEEFGYWLDTLAKKFNVTLDADDTIIRYLYDHHVLIPAKDIHENNGVVLRSKSDRMLKFLSEHSEEIDGMIKSRAGYIGKRKAEE